MHEVTTEGKKIRGTLFRADAPNLNGVEYPRAVLEKLVDDCQEKIEARRFIIGSGDLTGAQAIVTRMWMGEEFVEIEAELLPAGEALVEGAVSFNAGCIATTTEREDGVLVVGDDCVMVGVGIVPSERVQ